MAVYRVDFHHHVKGDPVDLLIHTIYDLIDAAAHHGIHALAVTPHGAVFHHPEARRYASQKGILLICGVEKRIEGKEVLLLNLLPEDIPPIMTFEDLKRLRAQKGKSLLVVAPHPFYPSRSCMGESLDRYGDLFDAIEYAHLHLPCYNPNDRAVEWSRAHRKALISNSDTHALFMIGRNYTEVEASELSVDSIFEAIRERKCKPIVHVPSWWEVGRFLIQISAFQAVIRFFIPSRTGDPFAKKQLKRVDQIDESH